MLEKAHLGVWGHDEIRFDTTISTIYQVDLDEAREIHADFHMDRILRILISKSSDTIANENFTIRVRNLGLSEIASQVAKGTLTEAAAVDLLHKRMKRAEEPDLIADRYLNFYG